MSGRRRVTGEGIGGPLTLSAGPLQRFDPSAADRGGDAMDEALAYAEKAGEHLWIATTAHRVSKRLAEEIARGGGDGFTLDLESLMFVGVGCFRCEQPLDSRLVHRACPGEPE